MKLFWLFWLLTETNFKLTHGQHTCKTHFQTFWDERPGFGSKTPSLWAAKSKQEILAILLMIK